MSEFSVGYSRTSSSAVGLRTSNSPATSRAGGLRRVNTALPAFRRNISAIKEGHEGQIKRVSDNNSINITFLHTKVFTHESKIPEEMKG